MHKNSGAEKIYIFDTTLRDGAQSANISFSVHDKISLIERFDDIGIDYIEVGFPASNPKDEELFGILKKKKLNYSRVVAFGRTKHKNIAADSDDNLKALIDSGADALCIFGKSSSFHVNRVIETTPEINLEMIFDSVKYLKKHSTEVIYDAEHFFDGYKLDSGYSIKTLIAARDGGADYIVLCDTNGGSLPGELLEIVTEVSKVIDTPLGLHCHNDSGCAVANSILAVERVAGVKMIQGTVNGYGERCGNTDLCQVIPCLELKLARRCLPAGNLKHLTNLSRFVSETANQTIAGSQPF
ncbi:MAG: citramalate synthase, partial [Actinobacteria bacterium]|nr:citramalate synthase [Actinomycetota bacterium]